MRGKDGILLIVLFVILVILLALVLPAASRKAPRGAAGGATAPSAAGVFPRAFMGGAADESEPTHVLLPAGRGPHTHTVAVGAQGRGISSEDRGHRHLVADLEDIGVLTPEGKPGVTDHKHDVSRYIISREG